MGRALEHRRFEFLPEMAQAQRVLILGEGDGRFLATLLRFNDRAQIDVVDSSAKMLAMASHRVGAVAQQISFHHADALHWSPPAAASYDLIVTHFFLDCFSDDELGPLVQRCCAAADPQCRWIVSEFHQPAGGFAAWRAHLWISTLYRMFGWTTGLRVRRLPDYQAILERHGFRQAKVVVAEMGLLISELRERCDVFAFDAPADAPLHSRTPKS